MYRKVTGCTVSSCIICFVEATVLTVAVNGIDPSNRVIVAFTYAYCHN